MCGELQTLLKSLVIQYTSFVEGSNTIPWLTSKDKFELDMKTLLDNGYESLSFEDAVACRNGLRTWPEKAFCIGFWGGYLNNYTIAYPILKKYKIKASIFISPELVDSEIIPDDGPRLGWKEAQEMVDSGLVHIYPLWNNNDIGKDFTLEIRSKINALNEHILNNNASFAIAFNNKELDNYSSKFIKDLGVQARVAYRYSLSTEDVNNGTFLSFRVDTESHVINTIELINNICKLNFRSDEASYKALEIYDEPDEEMLNETIILPIDTKPIVSNYMRHAVPLSVIQAERKDIAELYALSECIEVTFTPWNYWFDYHNYSYEYWESIEYRKITKDILDMNSINIIHYIINGLKTGYYSDLWLDTYYIPNKPGYREQHKTHGILIYGFDSDNQVFNAISYTDKGHYQSFNVTPKEVALGCTNKYFVYLNLIKRNPIDFTVYSIDSIYQKLTYYINSMFYDDNTRFVKKSPNQYYNHNACIKFADVVLETAQNSGYIPKTMMYSYVEHKLLMAWRVKYIVEHEHLDLPNIINETDLLKLNSEKLMNFSIKFNLTQSNRLIESIIVLINQINNDERILIDKLLNVIKEKYYSKK